MYTNHLMYVFLSSATLEYAGATMIVTPFVVIYLSKHHHHHHCIGMWKWNTYIYTNQIKFIYTMDILNT
jgi:hypothetical protein